MDAFSSVELLETLNIPASVTQFASTGYFGTVENPFNCCPKLSAITVDNNNASYSVQDGVLFSHDKTTLVCYPEGRAGGPSAGHYPLTVVKMNAQKKLNTLKSQLTWLNKLDGKVPGDVLLHMRQTVLDSIKKELKSQLSSTAGIIANATGYYTVPNGTKTILSWAFGGTQLSTVEIPDSVSQIASSSFQNAAGVSICANSDSYAHDYAVETGIPFIAAVPSSDGFQFTVDGANNATITGYAGGDTEITIPHTVSDANGSYTVTAIADQAFMGSDILSVAIPNTVKTIGSDAFAMSALTSIKIPDSVTNIGDGCFGFCTQLESVKLPLDITSLGDATFAFCSSLNDITLPNGIESLGQDCFCFCDALPTINLPEGLKSLGSGCFTLCTVLSGVVLPESLESIGDSCFFYDDALASVTIHENVTSIGGQAFDYCDSLEFIIVDSGNDDYKSDDGVLYDKARSALMCYPSGKSGSSFTIPADITTIDDGAFSGDGSLTTIFIGAGVTDIGQSAFLSTKLQAITVDAGNSHYANYNGDGVLYDKDYTYLVCYPIADPAKEFDIPQGITSLSSMSLVGRLFETVNIPVSVMSIDMTPLPQFFLCKNLLNINVAAGNPQYASLSGLLTDKATTTILEFPCGNTGNSGCYSIPSGVTAVADYAFEGNMLSSISFPASVKTLGIDAFVGSENLEMAIFYGNVYNADPDPNNGPFELEGPDFKVYYHISKYTNWKSFRAYPSQPFCTLTLNLQDSDGSKQVVAPITLKPGKTYGTISAPTAPTRVNYQFAGWYKEAACKNAWSFSKDTVSKDTTLFAKWVAGAVTGVQASPQTYNSILVTWTAIPGVAGYEVSRSTSQNSGFKVLGTAASASYKDKNAVTGTTYYYRVRAYVKYGSTKYYGDYSTVSAPVHTILSKPTSVVANRLSATSIKLTWVKVAGATKYEIRQYVGSLSGPEKSFYSTSASFTDKKLTTGTQYYYVVVAYRKVGSQWVTSDASDPISATP